ncbi:protein kinase [Mactra antiquata]
MSAESPENEWELSKENVQPLKQGRKITSLNAGLKQLSGDEITRIKDEKHVFEAELRTYSGDDPLEIWYKYILWTEQTFPKGGKDSNLTTILERCVRQFKEEEIYRNDERYIYAWMKMADICNDPLEIYKFMYDQNIGCELGCFYEGWACLLEQLGNVKKADMIFKNGIAKNARPIDHLRLRYEDFHKRVARKILKGDDDTGEDNVDSGEQHRQVLSQLRTMGKKKRAPIGRTGSAIEGGAGVLGTKSRSNVNNNRSNNVQVYYDENSAPSVPDSLPPQTGEWSAIPKHSITNKENEKKPGVWTKQKISKPSISVPVSAVSSYKQLSFPVYEDTNNDQSMRTPLKKPEIDCQKVLSTRKLEKESSSSCLKTISEGHDKTERPMYCKEKIYLGVEEYSFEELRAIGWYRLQEKRNREKMEEEHRAVTEMRLKLEAERQQLLDEAERVRQQRQNLQQEEQAMLEMAKKQVKEHQQQMEIDRNSEIKRQQEQLEKEIHVRLEEQLTVSWSQRSARQLNFGDSSHGNTENIPPQMMAQLQSSKSKRPLMQVSVDNRSMNSSTATPNSFANISQPRSSEKSFDRTLSGAPSPTVNTKEAMRLVRGMFNKSLERQQEDEDVDMEEPAPPSQTHAVPQSGGMPFTVYDESQENQYQKPSSAPITVFCDDDASAPEPMNTSINDIDSNKILHQPDHGLIGNRKTRSNSQSQSIFDDGERIESRPRDDITLAPLGSHLSFAACAKFASTPFNPNNSGSGGKRDSPHFDLNPDVDMQTDEGVLSSKVPVQTSDSTIISSAPQTNLEQTVNNSVNNLSTKSLSPIIEGSSEESSAASHSNYQRQNLPDTIHNTPKLTPVMDQSEDTRNLLQAVDDRNQSIHVIDTSAYLPPEMDEKTEQLLSTSVYIEDPKDPFDAKEREQMLSCLKTSLHHIDTYSYYDELLPNVRIGDILSLGCDAFEVISKIGEGGYGKIYLAEDTGLDFATQALNGDTSTTSFALKVEQPSQKWEFYICNELHHRLAKIHDGFDTRPGIIQIHNGYFFQNGSVLVTQYQPHGTLLDLVNKCKNSNLWSEAFVQDREPVMVYMTIELLHIIEHVHKCQIIHGDIKPDNFLVLQFPYLPVSKDADVVFKGPFRFVQLIDFGQSIDMSKYPAGTTFLTKVNTQGFQCIEMKTNRPWTYQTDLFGLAGTIHVLIFSQYMNIYQEAGEWKMTSKFNRHWNSGLWKKLFNILLNVPSCDEIPDLSVIRKEFEDYFINNLIEKYNSQCASFNKVVTSCK